MSQNKTVVQLRAELKAQGLSTKGNKSELEARLAEAAISSTNGEEMKEDASSKEEKLENQALEENKLENAEDTSNIIMEAESNTSQENEKDEGDRKRVKLNSESPEKAIVDQLDHAKNDSDRLRIFIRLIFDPVTRKEAISLAKSNLLLFRLENGLSSSYEALLCQLEIDSEEDEFTASSYYERAGMLQKIAFQCGVMDCALGAPSKCVETAIHRNFFLDEENAHSLFCEILGVSDSSVSKEALKSALLRYFTRQEDELIQNDFHLFASPASANRTLLTSSLRANSLRQLLIRLIFQLKLELVHPRGRLERVFFTSQLPKEMSVIAKVGSTQVKIGEQFKGTSTSVKGWTPLDRFADKMTLDRLEKMQGLVGKKFAPIFERSLLGHKMMSLESNDSTKSSVVDFGYCFPNGLSQLKECFPEEIDPKLDVQDDQTDRFVVTFNRKKGATVVSLPRAAPRSLTTRTSLHPAQIQALRECLTSKQMAYVYGPTNSGKTELASQLVATLATVHRRAKILVVSGRSASHAADVLHRARDRALGLLDVKEMVVACGSSTPFFSPSRCVQRLARERTKVLEQCALLAKEMNVEDPIQSGRSCEFAHNFLIQAMKMETQQEKLDELVRLKSKVNDLLRFELFLSRPKEAQRFALLSHCRIVGASIDSLGQVGNHFDYIVADDVYTQEQLVLIGSIFESSSLNPTVICFGRNPQPEFAVESTASLSSVPSVIPRFVPGLSRSFTRKAVVSLKEEAELAVGCFKYLTKIGYEPQDIRLWALSSKQCRSLEELVSKELSPFPPAVYGPDIPTDSLSMNPTRIVIVALGGAGRERNQQQLVDELLALRTDALIILSSDREWIKSKVNIPNEFRVKEDSSDMNDENDALELVLGERLGEAFDEELRSSTKYSVNKLSDLTSILANLV